MSLKGMKARWIVVPLAVFFLLFSTGVAAAPDCHIGSTVQTSSKSAPTHNHSGLAHDHSHQSSWTAVSGVEEFSILADKALDNEVCFFVGFLVLLFIRFLRIKKLTFMIEKISQSRFILPLHFSKHLSHLNLTHLQMGIIRT